MQKEMSESFLVFVPKRQAEYFEKDALFGGEVSQAFPSAWEDIRDAGNCIAADLHTAAVFHLMRVGELGMRALARHLRVKVQKTRKAKASTLCPNCKAVISATIPSKLTYVLLV